MICQKCTSPHSSSHFVVLLMMNIIYRTLNVTRYITCTRFAHKCALHVHFPDKFSIVYINRTLKLDNNKAIIYSKFSCLWQNGLARGNPLNLIKLYSRPIAYNTDGLCSDNQDHLILWGKKVKSTIFHHWLVKSRSFSSLL